jgi:hypothetical protein
MADCVVVPLRDGDLLLEEPGASRGTPILGGTRLARREGVEDNVVNANAYTFSFIEIEHLKDGLDAERKSVIDGFVTAWNAHDLGAIMACMADDCVFWSSAGAHPEGGVFVGREAPYTIFHIRSDALCSQIIL